MTATVPGTTSVAGRSRLHLSGLTSLLQEAPLALLGLAGVCVFAFWAWNNAGYDPLVWYPGAVAFVALLVAVVLAVGKAERVPAGLLAAIGSFGAFAALNYASIGWADVRGTAFDGANRTLLYVLVFAVFALIPWSQRTAALVVGAYILAITAVALVSFLHAVDSSQLSRYFIDGRFSEPAGYPNANAALFLSAAWPALFLSSRRSVPVLARALLLAAAGTLLEISLICQSRGAVLATAIAVPIVFAIVPGRVRLLVSVAALALASAIAAPAMLDVYRATDQPLPALPDALHHAAVRLGLASVLLVATGLVWGLIDRRIVLGSRLMRALRLALGGAAVIAIVGGATIGVVAGRPVKHAQEAWSSFRHEGDPAGGQSSRFVSLGSNRYDFYRVAVHEFSEHPLLGVGSDGFAVDYARERRSSEEPLYPHSAILRIPAQTGLVGSMLMLLFGASVAWLLLHVRRTAAWATAAALAGSFAYLFIHSAADWFWEFPALTGPAFMFLGIAVGLLGRAPRAARTWRDRRWVRFLLIVPPGAAAVALFGFPWLSARDVQTATASWRSNPNEAFALLHRAADLNPFSSQPYLVAGTIAGRVDDRTELRVAFEKALERDPSNWYATLELGVLELDLGHRARARSLVERARALNPREPTVALVQSDLELGRPISFATLGAIYRARLARRLDSGLRTTG